MPCRYASKECPSDDPTTDASCGYGATKPIGASDYTQISNTLSAAQARPPPPAVHALMVPLPPTGTAVEQVPYTAEARTDRPYISTEYRQTVLESGFAL